MRIGPDDKFWVVTDATPDSVLEDICFETSIRGLELQFRGGLSMDSNPTIYTSKWDAEKAAKKRLKAAEFIEKFRQARISDDEGE
jgi:hypothetical protein